MKQTRRTFVKACAAAGVAGSFGIIGRAEASTGDVYPGWKPGEMDLHFVYTGCGENMFYRLPDGTAILNDTGDFYRPRDLKHIPLLPSSDRLGGEWMSRYVQRVYPEKTIDYLIFTHWHGDHIGQARFNTPETPGAAFRFKVLADGTRGNGFMCVAQDFGFRRYLDHQYPERGTHHSEDPTTIALVDPWLEKQRKKGLVCERFDVGALNQIALQRDPGKYPGFSIRNICSNGRLWDGKGGVHDYAAEHVAKTGKDRVSQNLLSLAYVIQYGKFRYFMGGDVSEKLKRADGSTIDYEELVGRSAGPVTVCKMNHHGCSNAMSEGFVRAVHAQAYVSCIWCPGQVHEVTLSRMASREIHPDFDPLILPNLMPQCQAEKYKDRDFMRNIATRGAAHVVVKVLPGGDAYRIYLLEARDESMRILARFDRRA